MTDDERLRRLVRLLQVVAHDIRNPLGVAQLKAEVMKRKAAGDEKLAKDLDVITRNTQQIAKLVDQLVDVAAVESDTFSIDKKPVPVAALLRDAVSAGGERVSLSAAPADDVELSCDRDRMLQAIGAVIEQALVASTDPVTVTASLRDGELVVEVDDRRATLDDPTTHFDRWAHTKSNGFGLTIARGIVTAHGGRIDVAARADGGARVTLIFPR